MNVIENKIHSCVFCFAFPCLRFHRIFVTVDNLNHIQIQSNQMTRKYNQLSEENKLSIEESRIIQDQKLGVLADNVASIKNLAIGINKNVTESN